MTELSEGSSTPKETIEFRRCIMLAIVGSTHVENANLKLVLENGYLSTVKTWYDQILQGSLGAPDLDITRQKSSVYCTFLFFIISQLTIHAFLCYPVLFR